MTDLTPSAAELAAITLNGRRLTPEQSSWLVGSLHHERAYCSTPGELLELLSHPTPPPAPEVEAIRDRFMATRAAAMSPEALQMCTDIGALLTALDAATQRAEAAERELTNANTRLESAALTLAEAVRERDEARDERKFAIDAFCDFVRVVEGAASTDAIDTALRTAYRQINEALGTEHMIPPGANDGVRCKLGELMRDDALKAPPTPPAAPSELAPGEALKPSTIRAVTGNLRQLAKHMPKSLPGGGWIAEWGANIIEHQAAALVAPASHPTADIKTHNVSLDNAAPSELAGTWSVEADLRFAIQGITDCGPVVTTSAVLRLMNAAERAASALSTPGSEAPEIGGPREEPEYPTELVCRISDRICERTTRIQGAKHHWTPSFVEIRMALWGYEQAMGIRLSTDLTPLASPAAGKEAM